MGVGEGGIGLLVGVVDGVTVGTGFSVGIGVVKTVAVEMVLPINLACAVN